MNRSKSLADKKYDESNLYHKSKQVEKEVKKSTAQKPRKINIANLMYAPVDTLDAELKKEEAL